MCGAMKPPIGRWGKKPKNNWTNISWVKEKIFTYLCSPKAPRFSKPYGKPCKPSPMAKRIVMGK